MDADDVMYSSTLLFLSLSTNAYITRVYDVNLRGTDLAKKIIDAISKKERHYNHSYKQNINLLIYQNFNDIQLNRIKESVKDLDSITSYE